MKLIYTKKEVNKMNNYLQKLNINENLKKEINLYRESYPVSKELLYRIPKPDNLYYGDEIWNQAVTALLCGENILLVGHKATGKNIFAENLAAAFGRPKWDISFHVNMDAASLIGMDTFRNGEVTFRPGPVYSAAKSGGFAILDEIDSGLDIDALKVVAKGVNSMRGEKFGALIITHYQRLLDYITPDVVHIMMDGRVVKTGGAELAKRLETEGYVNIAEELGLEYKEEV